MKKLLFIPLTILATSLNAKPFHKVSANLEKSSKFAKEEMKRTGIPALVTLSQAGIESSYGKSHVAQVTNNYFGIKCTSPKEKGYKGYRIYPTAYASFKDHSNILKRYANLSHLSQTDLKGWAKGIAAHGYAEDPNYEHKMIVVMKSLSKNDKPTVTVNYYTNTDFYRM